ELRLLLVPAQGRKGAHPRQRRAAPVLPAWDEVTALVQDSHPYHVGRLLALPRRGRINRRAAAWTERLQASIAALGRGLEVCRRLARYAKGCIGNGNINAKGGAGANLAIRAVANRGLLGVRFAFDPDIAAVARAVDFHEFVPFRRSASAIAFIGTPAQVPSSFGPYIMMRFWPPGHAHLRRDQSSSASRFTAGAFAFFILSQSGERPERYIECLRFDTMPSLR